MKQRKTVYTDENREQLIADAEEMGEVLRVDARTVTEGNYLIFSPMTIEESGYIQELENQVLLLSDEVEGGIL